MKYIPSLIRHPIEREEIVDQLPEEEHPSVKKNAQILADQNLVLNRINESCDTLRSTAPIAWKIFEEDLSSLYSGSLSSLKKSPTDYMEECIDPDYYAILNAYHRGKVEILESIFRVTKITPVEINKSPAKNILSRTLDKLKKLF